jgi:hypothetical protein
MSVAETQALETPLTVADHTLVMEAIIDRSANVVMQLRAMGVVPEDEKPTQAQVLDAALRVRVLDPEVRGRLERTRSLLAEAGQKTGTLPADAAGVLTSLKEEISGKPVEEMIIAISQLRAEQPGSERVADALQLGEQLLRDGADTIYKPSRPATDELILFGFFEDLFGIAEADVVATVESAVSAPVGDGVIKTVDHAVAQGISASLTDLIVKVWL